MQRKTLLASLFAVLLAGSASFVLAQAPAAPAAPPAPATQPVDGHMHGMRGPMQRGAFQHRGMRGGHQGNGVIGNLRGLERLYQDAGRSKEMIAVYNDVLAKSQDPRVRGYVYQRLARLQAQPTNVDQAIATLRKGLDENLANEAKMRAEREKMRAAWQKRADKAAPAAK